MRQDRGCPKFRIADGRYSLKALRSAAMPNIEIIQDVLPSEILPTESYADDHHYADHVSVLSARKHIGLPTESDVLGPFYRPGAPARAKVGPPHEPGTVLLIKGRVWGYDTKRPIPDAILEIWQASTFGHYDNEDPLHPPGSTAFRNRVRIITTSDGRYEFETIHPGPYRIDDTTWRACHIHFRVAHAGYVTLITQLFFEGDPLSSQDPFFKQSLAIPLRPEVSNGEMFESGRFEIVLAPVDDVSDIATNKSQKRAAAAV